MSFELNITYDPEYKHILIKERLIIVIHNNLELALFFK
jgi:hypothetical protein